MFDYSKLDQPEVLSHIFHPRPVERSILPLGATDLDWPVAGAILGCRFYAASKEAPTILFFHGNGEIVSDYDEIAGHYVKHGMNLLMTTYRGYGWSSGQPTVSTMFADGEAIYSLAVAWLAEQAYTGPIFVMGRSLGSAAAIDLAANHPDSLKGMIIESGFADTLPLTRTLGIDTSGSDITEDECFNNCRKIETIKLPTMILHGARDTMISVPQAEKLQACSGAKNKQFLIIPGAEHNTMIDCGGALYFQTIKKFIDSITGTSDWRRRRKEQQEARGQNGA